MESKVESLENEIREAKINMAGMNANMTKMKANIQSLQDAMSDMLRTLENKVEEQRPEVIKKGVQEEERNGEEARKVRTKLELPVFSGNDPSNWLFRAERYFFVNGIVNANKLQAAIVCLDGPALAWFQWREERRPIPEWQEFKTALRQRFCQAKEDLSGEKEKTKGHGGVCEIVGETPDIFLAAVKKVATMVTEVEEGKDGEEKKAVMVEVMEIKKEEKKVVVDLMVAARVWLLGFGCPHTGRRKETCTYNEFFF